MKYRIVASLLVIALVVVLAFLLGTGDDRPKFNPQPAGASDSSAASTLRIP